MNIVLKGKNKAYIDSYILSFKDKLLENPEIVPAVRKYIIDNGMEKDPFLSGIQIAVIDQIKEGAGY